MDHWAAEVTNFDWKFDISPRLIKLVERSILRLFQHTFGTQNARNLYQQAISRDSFHNWRTGDGPNVCSGGVL